MRRRGLVLVLVLGIVGCVQSKSVPCGAFVCALNDVCAPSGDRCVQPDQLSSCQGKNDGDGCSYPGVTSGVCGTGICGPVGCGNGVVEASLGEICDDGNRLDGDGCNAQCTSMERCGDGVVDAVHGEQCDCGDPGMTVDGCTMDNSNIGGATCRPDCHPARCGDGIVDPHEICDDGNVDPGDGCRSDCAGRWTVMPSGTYANLAAVWGTAANDVWAVGRDVALHFDGTRWIKTQLPLADMQLSDVWGTSGGDVYAVGVVVTVSPNGGRLLKWNGASWDLVPSFPGNTAVGEWAMYGSSSTDMWLVNTQGALDHWDGTNWTSGNCVTFSGAGSVTEFESVYVDPGGHAYAATLLGEVCRFNAGTWTAIDPVLLGASHVWGTGAADLYATAAYSDTFDLVSHSTNGTSWSGEQDARIIVYGEGLGGSPGDIIVVGDQGRVIRFNGTSWDIAPTTVSVTLRDAWGYAPGKAFIVGDNGTILY